MAGQDRDWEDTERNKSEHILRGFEQPNNGLEQAEELGVERPAGVEEH